MLLSSSFVSKISLRLVFFLAGLSLVACNQTMDHDWQMQVYPVVNFGQFTVRAIGSEPSVTAVRVLNTQGQPVDERLFEDPNNDIRISYDLSGQGAGTYTIVLMSDSEVLEHATTITVQR